MEYSEFEQGSMEWLLARVGRFSASNAYKLLDRNAKGLPTAEFTNYRWQLIVERLTGQPTYTFENDAMRWGKQTEPVARSFYEALTDKIVEQVALVEHATLSFVICSPDGMVDEDGGLEIKCLTTKNHLEVILTDKPIADHVLQCQFQMWVMERDWIDLLYFDPRLPDYLQAKIFEIERDEEVIAKLESNVLSLEADINKTIEQLQLNQ